jgi:hypothetical protein
MEDSTSHNNLPCELQVQRRHCQLAGLKYACMLSILHQTFDSDLCAGNQNPVSCVLYHLSMDDKVTFFIINFLTYLDQIKCLFCNLLGTLGKIASEYLSPKSILELFTAAPH